MQLESHKNRDKCCEDHMGIRIAHSVGMEINVTEENRDDFHVVLLCKTQTTAQSNLKYKPY